MSKRKTLYGRLRLLLLNGKEIIIDYQEDIFEEIWDNMMMKLEKDGVWFCGNWDFSVLEVDYLGYTLDYVDMSKVIGIIQ